MTGSACKTAPHRRIPSYYEFATHTTDGVMMLGAYEWAFVRPIRKLYYNMTITLVSVIVAFLIGGIEALGLIADRLQLAGGFWDAMGALNGELNISASSSSAHSLPPGFFRT